jgi:hypothetical protein
VHMSITSRMKALIAMLLLSLAAHAVAVTIAGKTLADTVEVGQQPLRLNGAGMRRMFFFRVYIGALYLRQPLRTPEAVLADAGPKRIELYMMRHADADDFMDAFNEGISNNQTPQELQALSARLARFNQVFSAVGAVDEDTVILLDYLPQPGETVVTINGKERMRIAGADFYAGLLKIWLGKHPAQESLKKAMLGG